MRLTVALAFFSSAAWAIGPLPVDPNGQPLNPVTYQPLVTPVVDYTPPSPTPSPAPNTCQADLQAFATAIRGTFQSTNDGTSSIFDKPGDAIYVIWQLLGNEQFSTPINQVGPSLLCDWADAVATPPFSIGGVGFGTPRANCGGLAAFTACYLYRYGVNGVTSFAWCSKPGHAFVRAMCGGDAYLVDAWMAAVTKCGRLDCSDAGATYTPMSCTPSMVKRR